MRRAAFPAALIVLGAVAALPSHAAPPSRIVFAANGAPAAGGEIYRVTAGGRRIDLSRSPALDAAPAVSPNGKTVAFLSTRSGHLAFYTVGIDGGHLRQISPLLSPFDLSDPYLDADIEWSPNGKTLAVQLLDGTVARVFLLDANGGGWRAVSPANDIVLTPASWSPDGRLAYVGQQRHDVYVSSSAGVVLWRVHGSGAAWSAHGRLVVQTSAREASVYSVRGRKLASFAAGWTAWSPNGNTLASLSVEGTFQTRAGGTGAPTLELAGLNPDPFGLADLAWIGEQNVRYLTPAGWQGLEVATRIPFALPPGFASRSSVASPDGLEAAAGIASGATWTLELSKLGGPTRTLANAQGCDGADPFSTVEFAQRASSLVYMSGCFDPPGDLYSVSPDGSDLQRLTRTTADESDPTVSPDGSTIAYVKSVDFHTCATCGDSIWAANADGSDPRQLTRPPGNDPNAGSPDDASPSFSPDGTQIIFERDGDTSSDLYVVPAAGGPAKSLDVDGYFPSWGPQRIAYVDDNLTEMTAAPDGSDRQPFAVNGRLVAGPTAWSSDGRLAVLAGVDDVSTIVLSTGQKIPLPGLQLSAQAGGITWSPDGTELAFIAADSAGVADVYTVGVDGTGLTRITHDLGATSGISWR